MIMNIFEPEEWDEENEYYRDAGEKWCDQCAVQMKRIGCKLEYTRPAVAGDEDLYCDGCGINLHTGKKRG